jgi:hypothetical protein
LWATTRDAIRATTALAAVVSVATLSACVPLSPRDRAIESARTSWQETLAGLEASLPSDGENTLRGYAIEVGSLGVSSSLLDADEAAIRAVAYELQSQASFVLEISENGAVGTVLLYISGVFETGGGLTYEKEIVYSCAAVEVDLENHHVLGYEGAECTAPIYSVVGSAGETDFDEIVGDADGD